MRTRGTPQNGRVVLLVDADADTRTMYAEYLRYQGFHVMPVATAGRALMLASKVDVIVTELLLPGFMDGIGLIEQLKSDHESSGTPLIVVTACAWERERMRAEHAGCDRFLPKPCLPDELAREARQLLATTPSRPTVLARHPVP